LRRYRSSSRQFEWQLFTLCDFVIDTFSRSNFTKIRFQSELRPGPRLMSLRRSRRPSNRLDRGSGTPILSRVPSRSRKPLRLAYDSLRLASRLRYQRRPRVHVYVRLHVATDDRIIPRSRLSRYGSRSFAVCGPAAWNSLPVAVRDLSSSASTFCRHLKTELFSRAYGVFPP